MQLQCDLGKQASPLQLELRKVRIENDSAVKSQVFFLTFFYQACWVALPLHSIFEIFIKGSPLVKNTLIQLLVSTRNQIESMYCFPVARTDPSQTQWCPVIVVLSNITAAKSLYKNMAPYTFEPARQLFKPQKEVSRTEQKCSSEVWTEVVYGHVHWSLRILVKLNISDPTKWHDDVKCVTLWNYIDPRWLG